MKKVFGSNPKKVGEDVTQSDHRNSMLSCVHPNLVVFAKKLFGSVVTGAAVQKQEMFMALQSSKCHIRQRHPAGVNHVDENLGKVRAERIVIEGNLLWYSEENDEKVGVYVGESPVSEQHNYFEVEILKMGGCGTVCIGLCSRKYPLHKLPGWARDSIGYHADDGKLYRARSNGGVDFGPKCTAGDRMGCGIKYELVSSSCSSDTLPVFFTKNGIEIDCVKLAAPAGGFYPCIGLGGRNDAVRLIPHHLWPVYEDTYMSVDYAEDDWSKLQNVRINGKTLQYTGREKGLLDVGLAQAKSPLNTGSHFFQLKIVDPGRLCYITIGLAKKNYPKHSHLGWRRGSIAYHADDGNLFEGNTTGNPFGPPCDKGDIMGCGIIFPRDFISTCDRCGGDCHSEEACEENEEYLTSVTSNDELSEENSDPLELMPNSEDDDVIESSSNREGSNASQNQILVEVFFTQNGKMIGQKEMIMPRGGFYPSISMGSLHECVKIDLHPLSG